jgi:hypothetical protein
VKIRTVILQKVDNKKPAEKKSKIIYVALLLTETVVNTILPFLCGFYLATTGYLFWFVPLFILLFFNIRIEYKDDIEIKILRSL